RCCCTRG
ncbi:hypothetical protein CARUB_v100038641mg, partial [Capsella rubella]